MGRRAKKMQTPEQQWFAQQAEQAASPAAKRRRADQRLDEMRELIKTSCKSGTHDQAVRDRIDTLQAEAYELGTSAVRAEREALQKKDRKRRRRLW